MIKLVTLEKNAKPILTISTGDEQKMAHVKLGGIDLIKREDKNGVVREIRSINYLSVFGKRAIVYDGTQKFLGEVIDLDNNGSLIMRLDDSSIKKIIYYSNVSFFQILC